MKPLLCLLLCLSAASAYCESTSCDVDFLIVSRLDKWQPPEDFKPTQSQVRRLLGWLKQAEDNFDIDWAIDAITKVRALPGCPAKEIDDSLAFHLGQLNMLKLDCASNDWVAVRSVRRGDSIVRIAEDSGTPISLLQWLNDTTFRRPIIPGTKLRTMRNPKMAIVVRCDLNRVDLFINDKFFNRYKVSMEKELPKGESKVTGNLKTFWKRHGMTFLSPREEQEMQMFMTSSMLIRTE